MNYIKKSFTMGGALVAGLLLGAVAAVSADPVGALVYQFPAGSAAATSGLIETTPGVFYGCQTSDIYSISSGGAYNSLATFTAAQGQPNATLILASDSNYYGTTVNITNGGPTGNTVIKLTPAGVVSVLYDLSSPSGGVYPGGVVQASNGSLYGTTNQMTNGGGGGSSKLPVFYRVSLSGVYTKLFTFGNNGDGTAPNPVVQASDGNFYGGTQSGNACIYSLTPSGKETILDRETAGPGAFSLSSNGGTIFAEFNPNSEFAGFLSITPPDTIDVISSQVPVSTGQLVLGPDGNFYGSAPGGSHNHGFVFSVTPDGVVQTLYSLTSVTAGSTKDTATPIDKLCFGSDGKIYGVTPYAVFSVTLSTPPVTPVLNSITPTRVMQGGPSFTLTLSGSGFQGSTEAALFLSGKGPGSGYRFLQSTSFTSTMLSVTVPAADIAQLRKVSVYAFDPDTNVYSATSVPLTITKN